MRTGHVSRGTVRPYSQDLSELQESFERELYVNQRTLIEEIHDSNKKKHKYEYIDDEDVSDEDEFVNPLPLPPKKMLSKSQQSLAISPIRYVLKLIDQSGARMNFIDQSEARLICIDQSYSRSPMSRSQQSLASSTYSSPSSRGQAPLHSSPYGKRPIPAPRSNIASDDNSGPLTPTKRSSAR